MFRICYFGSYNRDYSRNAVLLRGLNQIDVEVIECNSVKVHKLLRYLYLILTYYQRGLNSDIILVHASGHNYVPLAWLLAKVTKKSLIFDPFVSMFDTYVNDRKQVKSDSLLAAWYYFLDKIACNLADKVLVDTIQHSDYFIKTFRLKKEKICVIPVGADDSVFHPNIVQVSSQDGKMQILYVGNFIPLHGVPYIIQAAKLLENENFHFTLIGNGQTYAEACKLANDLNLQNIRFVGRVSRELYAQHLEQADIVLGIFGESDKTTRVIPCKVYDAIAMGKVVITSNTAAIQSVFVNQKNICTCKPMDSASLAEQLQILGENAHLRLEIGRNAKTIFDQHFSPVKVAKRLLECTSGLLLDGNDSMRF